MSLLIPYYDTQLLMNFTTVEFIRIGADIVEIQFPSRKITLSYPDAATAEDCFSKISEHMSKGAHHAR